MADITACNHSHCPRRHECYRYLCIRSDWQWTGVPKSCANDFADFWALDGRTNVVDVESVDEQLNQQREAV